MFGSTQDFEPIVEELIKVGDGLVSWSQCLEIDTIGFGE